MVAEGGLLEHATVFGNSYGSPRGPVEEALAAGRDVLFDVDWQGTQQLRQNARNDLVSVFILPPSRAELERQAARPRPGPGGGRAGEDGEGGRRDEPLGRIRLHRR